MRSKWRFAVPILGLAFAAVFLWLSIRDTNVAAIRDAARAADLRFVPPFLLALFLYYWIKAVRWRVLLLPIKAVPTRKLFPSLMIGYGASAILPLQLGELIRVSIASRENGLVASPVLLSVALERVLDLIALLGLIAVIVVGGTTPPPAVLIAGYGAAAAAFVGLALFLLYVARSEAVAGFVERVAPSALGRKLGEQLRAGSSGLASLRQPRFFLTAMALSVGQWLLMWACVAFSLLALGIDAAPSTAFFTLVLVVIGISLPTSPGYVGSIQFAYALGLAPAGVDQAQAFAASLFFHVLAYVSVVVAGLYFTHRLGYRARQLARNAAATAD